MLIDMLDIDRNLSLSELERTYSQPIPPHSIYAPDIWQDVLNTEIRINRAVLCLDQRAEEKTANTYRKQ